MFKTIQSNVQQSKKKHYILYICELIINENTCKEEEMRK